MIENQRLITRFWGSVTQNLILSDDFEIYLLHFFCNFEKGDLCKKVGLACGLQPLFIRVDFVLFVSGRFEIEFCVHNVYLHNYKSFLKSDQIEFDYKVE